MVVLLVVIQVYRAVWKGTEVAVKVMSSKDVTKDMEKNFREEVSLITLSQAPTWYCGLTLQVCVCVCVLFRCA